MGPTTQHNLGKLWEEVAGPDSHAVIDFNSFLRPTRLATCAQHETAFTPFTQYRSSIPRSENAYELVYKFDCLSIRIFERG